MRKSFEYSWDIYNAFSSMLFPNSDRKLNLLLSDVHFFILYYPVSMNESINFSFYRFNVDILSFEIPSPRKKK